MPDERPAESADLIDQRDCLSGEIGRRRAAGQPADDLIARHRTVSARIKALQAAGQLDGSAQVPGLSPGCQDISTVTDSDTFAGLRTEWNALLDASAVVTPFMRWEWLYTWWEHFGAGKRLRIIASRDASGRLIGLAPMMLGLREHGRINRRVLAFIGTGEVAEGDYFSLLLRSGHESEALEGIWGALEGVGPEALVLRLQDVGIDDTSLASLASKATQGGRSVFAEPRRRSVVGPLPGSYEEFIATVPDKQRRNYLRDAERHIRNAGRTVMRGVAEKPDDVRVGLKALAQFSVSRQQAKGQISAWCDAGFARFMEAACDRLWASGGVRIDTLSDGEQILAVLLGFVEKRQYFCYQMGFLPGASALSPLHYLLAHRIRECIAEGCEAFDLLAGEHEYKTQYFSGRRPIGHLWIVPSRPDAMLRLGGVIVSQALRRQVKAWLRRGD